MPIVLTNKHQEASDSERQESVVTSEGKMEQRNNTSDRNAEISLADRRES